MQTQFDLFAIEDPTLRRTVETALTEFHGASADGTASAVVLGDLTVQRVEVQDTTSAPAIVGRRLVECINAALASARDGSRSAMMSIPGLGPSVRAALSGDSDELLEDVAIDVDRDEIDRDFVGSEGDVVVTVNGLSQQVTSVQVPDLNDETLALIPSATNRSLASAQTGQQGAEPLGEKTDEILASLDEKMSALEQKLDGVEDTLDALARDLGI